MLYTGSWWGFRLSVRVPGAQGPCPDRLHTGTAHAYLRWVLRMFTHENSLLFHVVNLCCLLLPFPAISDRKFTGLRWLNPGWVHCWMLRRLKTRLKRANFKKYQNKCTLRYKHQMTSAYIQNVNIHHIPVKCKQNINIFLWRLNVKCKACGGDVSKRRTVQHWKFWHSHP